MMISELEQTFYITFLLYLFSIRSIDIKAVYSLLWMTHDATQDSSVIWLNDMVVLLC